MKKVLVTGAAGHLGFELASQLHEKGYKVTASVRKTTSRTKQLEDKGIKVITLDLANKAEAVAAMREVDVLFQVAAVFNITARDPQKEVVAPNLEITRNALEAAAEAGIQQVIYTSSVAAIGTTTGKQSALTEQDWNLNAKEPYALSKAKSEQLAWQLAEQLGLKMKTVLPGAVFGPGAERPTSTMELLINIVKGEIPMALNASLSIVDIRDVALAHILVYESQTASGRYIATHETRSISQVITEMLRQDPDLKTSARIMPDWLARMLPGLDWVKSKLTGAPRTMKSDTLKEYLNTTMLFETPRLKTELNWSPRPIQDTIKDSLNWTKEYLSQTNGKATRS